MLMLKVTHLHNPCKYAAKDFVKYQKLYYLKYELDIFWGQVQFSSIHLTTHCYYNYTKGALVSLYGPFWTIMIAFMFGAQRSNHHQDNFNFVFVHLYIFLYLCSFVFVYLCV